MEENCCKMMEYNMKFSWCEWIVCMYLNGGCDDGKKKKSEKEKLWENIE